MIAPANAQWDIIWSLCRNQWNALSLRIHKRERIIIVSQNKQAIRREILAMNVRDAVAIGTESLLQCWIKLASALVCKTQFASKGTKHELYKVSSDCCTCCPLRRWAHYPHPVVSRALQIFDHFRHPTAEFGNNNKSTILHFSELIFCFFDGQLAHIRNNNFAGYVKRLSKVGVGVL